MSRKSIIIPLLILVCFFSGCINASNIENSIEEISPQVKGAVSDEKLTRIDLKNKSNDLIKDVNLVKTSLETNYGYEEYSQKIHISVEDLGGLGFDENIQAALITAEVDENYNVTYYGEIAYTISKEMEEKSLCEIKVSNVAFLEDYDNFKKEMNNLNRAIATINENSDMNIESLKIDKGSHTHFMTLLNKGEKYVPLVYSYNELIFASRNVLKDNTSEAFVKGFYIAAGMLAADILLIESGCMYKGAFKSVGVLNSELKLMKIRKYCGNSGYGLLLSNMHWYFRGRMETSKDELYDLIMKECTG